MENGESGPNLLIRAIRDVRITSRSDGESSSKSDGENSSYRSDGENSSRSDEESSGATLEKWQRKMFAARARNQKGLANRAEQHRKNKPDRERHAALIKLTEESFGPHRD